jgi:hypothetical protein
MKIPGIEITKIIPPESGWPIVARCYVCGKTVIVLSPWGMKPENGDYFQFNGMCLDEDAMLNLKHNLRPQYIEPWRVQNLESV